MLLIFSGQTLSTEIAYMSYFFSHIKIYTSDTISVQILTDSYVELLFSFTWCEISDGLLSKFSQET